jgi:phage N-6-adenine-methyltransferase
MSNKNTPNNPLWGNGGAGYGSATDNWSTPQHVFDALHEEFHFALDVCASTSNAKCRRFFTKKQNGLHQPWTGRCWMNPPYGRGIGTWMEKAANSADDGVVVVCLVPARTDTVWWHEQVMSRASEVRLVRGRLKFGDGIGSAPFPSAVVVYRPGAAPVRVSAWVVTDAGGAS